MLIGLQIRDIVLIEALDLSMYLEGVTFGSEDLLEAVAAFKEKRKGVWKGR